MTDEQKLAAESAIAGSSARDPLVDGSKGESNQSSNGDFVPKSQFEELEKKIGTQGEELGEYRTFFEKITPLLDKLEEQPELAQAIVDGRMTTDLVNAVLEGKTTQKEAEVVTKAHEEVKKDLGTKKYENASPEAIEKMVEKKVSEITGGLEKKIKSELSEKDELRDFEARTTNFINNCPDFADYAEDINKWLEDHPNADDIEIAYDAVKGKALAKEKERIEQEKAGEAAKKIAGNAGGGYSQGNRISGSDDIVDTLINRKSNPNIF